MSSRQHIYTISVITIFILLIALAVYSSVFTVEKPHITELSPPAAYPEDTLLIKGEGFGPERNGGDVLIAGIRLTSSHYEKWSDKEISITVPHGVQSGRVYVVTGNGKSNGVLFSNRAHIPLILSGPVEPGHPYIEAISPEKGAVGSRVTITGRNFGRRRGTGKVYFRFLAVDNTAASKDDSAAENSYVECSELDFDYEVWSDQELVVYVPDGAISGSVMVENDRGKSNALYFEVTTPVGSKRFEQSKGYQIQQDIRVSNVQVAEGENGLEIWIPKLFSGYAQRNIEAIHDPEPLWLDYRGIMRYTLKPPEDWFEYSLSHTYWFDRYSIRTDVDARDVADYNRDRKLYTYYTRANMFIPSENERIASVAASVAGRSGNAYRRAYALFEYVINRLEFDPAFEYEDLSECIDSRRAGSRDYGLLFTAMARSIGIPARPVAGFIVHGDKLTHKHIWAEFYVPQFGWVPADPALADGAGLFDIQVEEPASFYFGNLENQHISFTRQVVQLPKVNPHSKVNVLDEPYSLQSIYEEYPPELAGYRVRWEDIKIVDWW